MSAAGWVCGVLGVLAMLLGVCWTSFMAGRRYESGIWDAWLSSQEAIEEEQRVAEAMQRNERRVQGRRVVKLHQIKFRR